MVACSAGTYADRPPARFHGDNTAGVRFVASAQVNAACASMGVTHRNGVRGCAMRGVIVLPNPCAWPSSDYADLACHELAHVNGWPSDHPK